jgi:hypothetical protein
MSAEQRREFHEALLDADHFEDLCGKWQAAILKAERNRPKPRLVSESLKLLPRSSVGAPHGSEGFFHCLEHRQPHDLAFAEGPHVSSVGHRFDSALPADPNQTNRRDDLVSRLDEVLGLHPPKCPLLPNQPHELPDSFMTAKDKAVKGPPRQVINDFRVEHAVVHLATTVEVLVATPHYLHVLLRHRPPSISFDLGSANGEAQDVDQHGNVFMYGEHVGRVDPDRPGWAGWELEAAGPPWSPPPRSDDSDALHRE